MRLSKFSRRVLVWGNLIGIPLIWGSLIGIPLILVLIVAISWDICRYQVSRELAALRAEGLPTNAAELNHYLSIPAGEPDATEAWLKAIEAVNALTESKAAGGLPIVGTGIDSIPPAGEDWDQQAAAEAFLKQAEPALEAIRIAAATPGEVRLLSDLHDAVLNDVIGIRNLSRLILFAAQVCGRQELFDGAFENISHALMLSMEINHKTFFWVQLIRIVVFSQASEAIASLLPAARWEETKLIQLQQQLGANDFHRDMQHALITERASSLDIIRKSLWEPLRVFNERKTLRLFHEAIGAFDFDWPLAIKRLADLNSRVEVERHRNSMWNWEHLALTTMGTWKWTGEAGIRVTAKQRCLIVALAARRGQLQGKDLPENVNAIPDTLFASEEQARTCRVDPYSGDPLLIRQQDGEWIIYSVGSNLKDDGGTVETNESGEIPDIGYAFRW